MEDVDPFKGVASLGEGYNLSGVPSGNVLVAVERGWKSDVGWRSGVLVVDGRWYDVMAREEIIWLRDKTAADYTRCVCRTVELQYARGFANGCRPLPNRALAKILAAKFGDFNAQNIDDRKVLYGLA